MTGRRRTGANIDESLLASMQAGVAVRASTAEAPNTETTTNFAGAPKNAPSLLHPRTATNLLTTAGTGRQKAKSRTTLSVPCAVGDHARRLTLALSLAEGLEASIGATIQRALTLLEAKLEAEGIAVPKQPVRLRGGPRHL